MDDDKGAEKWTLACLVPMRNTLKASISYLSMKKMKGRERDNRKGQSTRLLVCGYND